MYFSHYMMYFCVKERKAVTEFFVLPGFFENAYAVRVREQRSNVCFYPDYISQRDVSSLSITHIVKNWILYIPI
jgi:hypothetical protein